jgi:phosphoglucosamine mutase
MARSTRRKRSPDGRARLFGTDGVRGVANLEPITSETALRLARALAYVVRNSSGRHRRILIGKDTRLSGYMLETAMASGVCSMGVDVWLVGPLPTPGIAFLTRSMRADAGVVISASHNPFQDNGIKFFSRDGFKLDDSTERRIEDLVFDDTELTSHRAAPDDIGKAARIDDAAGRYLVFLKGCVPRSVTFDGIRIVLDCANGAGYKVGPDVLDELGASVTVIGAEPDGKNINLNSGATNLDALRNRVIAERAQIGIALDGDADRALFIDERGELFDGDDVMALMGRRMAAAGSLAANTVVGTVMSNLGLEIALREHRLKLVRTEVGDPSVAREMREHSYNLGGEQSGHVIFMDHSTTGDGLITALLLLTCMAESGVALSELRAMTRVPQVLENVLVARRTPIESMPEVTRLINRATRKLGREGRIIVRYSGTEMLARVMVEGTDESAIRAIACDIGAAIKRAAGGPSAPNPAS